MNLLLLSFIKSSCSVFHLSVLKSYCFVIFASSVHCRTGADITFELSTCQFTIETKEKKMGDETKQCTIHKHIICRIYTSRARFGLSLTTQWHLWTRTRIHNNWFHIDLGRFRLNIVLCDEKNNRHFTHVNFYSKKKHKNFTRIYTSAINWNWKSAQTQFS